jgi:hypothetical protein
MVVLGGGAFSYERGIPACPVHSVRRCRAKRQQLNRAERLLHENGLDPGQLGLTVLSVLNPLDRGETAHRDLHATPATEFQSSWCVCEKQGAGLSFRLMVLLQGSSLLCCSVARCFIISI